MDRKVIRVDMSQLSTWRSCQLKEYFRYGINDRGIESTGSPSPKDPFIFGQIGHHTLEVWEDPRTWHKEEPALAALHGKWEEYTKQDKYYASNHLDWATLEGQVVNAIHRYWNFYKEEDELYTPVKSEVPFEIDLTPENPKYQVLFYGKIDNVVKRIDTQKYCSKEYKFYAQMEENPFYLGWASQVSDYCLALSAVFGNEYGWMSYRITRKIESPTLINFVEKKLHRTKNQLKVAAKLIVVQALQMIRLRELGPTFLVPALDDNPIRVANECLGCSYVKDICPAFIEGEDWKSIMDLNYQPRTLYAEYEENKNITQYEEELKEKGMAF